MENANVVAASEETSDGGEGLSSGQKALIGVVIILVLLLIGAVSYFVGRQSQDGEEEISPSPTEAITTSPTLTPTPLPDSNTSPSPAVSPTNTPTPTPAPVIKTMTLSSLASLDGFQSSNGGGNAGLDIRAGRNVFLATRGFVSFDITGIPEGATITTATLRLYQAKTEGDPYGAGGSLKVDHLNYGSSLENADYAAASLISNIATLTTNSTVEWKNAILTNEVKNDLSAGRTKSQFRIHFTTEVTGGDNTGDFAYFTSAEDKPDPSTGNTPKLIIKYY